MKRRTVLAGGLALLAHQSPVLASNRPMRFIVPFQAGAATDIAARMLGERFTKVTGRPVVVVNKPGADGLLAAREVINADPPGDTLLFATNTAITAVNTFHPKPFFDPLVDLTPILRAGYFDYILVANQSRPFATAEELVKFAKENPNQLTFASGSSTALVAMTQWADSAGIKLRHIPYNSEPPAVIDLVSGQTDVMFAVPATTLGFIKDKKIRALMVATQSRLPALPDVPTLTESGFADLTLRGWGGFFGPGKMDKNVARDLNRVLGDILATEETRQALAGNYLRVSTTSLDEFNTFVRDQLTQTAQVVREHNLFKK